MTTLLEKFSLSHLRKEKYRNIIERWDLQVNKVKHTSCLEKKCVIKYYRWFRFLWLKTKICFNLKIIINLILKIGKNHILLSYRSCFSFKSIRLWLMKSKTIIIYQELRNDCNSCNPHEAKQTSIENRIYIRGEFTRKKV